MGPVGEAESRSGVFGNPWQKESCYSGDIRDQPHLRHTGGVTQWIGLGQTSAGLFAVILWLDRKQAERIGDVREGIAGLRLAQAEQDKQLTAQSDRLARVEGQLSVLVTLRESVGKLGWLDPANTCLEVSEAQGGVDPIQPSPAPVARCRRGRAPSTLSERLPPRTAKAPWQGEG